MIEKDSLFTKIADLAISEFFIRKELVPEVDIDELYKVVTIKTIRDTKDTFLKFGYEHAKGIILMELGLE